MRGGNRAAGCPCLLAQPLPQRGVRVPQRAVSWSGLENGAYNFVTMVSALFLVGFAQKIGHP